MVKYTVIIGLLLGFTACEMGEIPVEPPPPGQVNTRQVETGNDYGTQVFYNVREQYVAGTLEKTAWDIGLMREANRWVLRLNSALGGGAARVEDDFEQVTDPTGLPFAIDASDGNPDSVAIGMDQAVYVIDRGYDPDGLPRGYHKLQLIDTLHYGCRVRLATLDNQQDTVLTLVHDTTRHLTPLSFTDYQSPAIPHRSDWDLFFTQYMFQFQEPPVAYLVTGVLLHPEGTRAALDTLQTFAEINFDDLSNYAFTDRWDAIGYDWKVYNYDEGLYEVDTSRIYILETIEGRYFKLQFLDFYTPTGAKGAPLFRLQGL